MRSRALRHLSVLAVGVALFFLQGPKLVRHPASRVYDDGDSLLNTWILAWEAHALGEPGVHVWDAPILYPVKNVLTFSETMFGNLWLTLPVQYLTGNPILAANLLILAAFVLCLYTTFFLVDRLTGCYWAGLAAGVLFSFNPIRWGQLMHLNLLPFFWGPLAFWGCHRFLETRRARPLALTCLAVVAQYYTSMNLGMLLSTSLLVFAGAHCLLERIGAERFFWVTDRRTRRLILAAGLLSFLLLIPLGLPYWRTIRDWNFTRTQADNISFSCEPLSFLAPTGSFRNYRKLHDAFHNHIRGYYGLGFVPWTLGLVGLVAVFRAREQFSDEQRRLARRLAVTAGVLAVLMLGPKLIWHDRPLPVPLPYMAVFHLFPGARAMRVPARFFLPLLLCLSVLAGFAVAWAVRWLRNRHPVWRLAVVLAAAAWLGLDYRVTNAEGVVRPMSDRFPAVYHYLKQTDPGRPVLELPAVWNRQFDYLYYQTAHWRPLLGGETGNFTMGHLETYLRTQGPPTEAMLQFLRLTPALTMVLHFDRFDPATAQAWKNAPLDRFGFRLAARVGDAAVWEQEEPAPATSPTLRVTGIKVNRGKKLWWNQITLALEVTPAEPGAPWRYLTRGVQEMEIQLTDSRGRVSRFSRTVGVPPYLLRGEKATILVETLTGIPKDVERLQLGGALLEPYEKCFREDSVSSASSSRE